MENDQLADNKKIIWKKRPSGMEYFLIFLFGGMVVFLTPQKFIKISQLIHSSQVKKSLGF